MRHVLGPLTRRWFDPHEEIKPHSRHLKQQTQTAAPQPAEAVGINRDTAAEMLVTASDNNTRIRFRNSVRETL